MAMPLSTAFAHVVDGEQGDADGGQSFHLAGAPNGMKKRQPNERLPLVYLICLTLIKVQEQDYH